MSFALIFCGVLLQCIHVGAHLMKCIKAYSDSQAAVNEWRTVGLHLGLGVEDVDAISQAEGIREQARTMLMKWIEIQGDKATKDSLINCLKKLDLKEAISMYYTPFP